MAEQFDLAIIGGGPGGYSTALRAAELGKRVAIIERDPTLGGTCLNRGCIPSKALLTATRALDTIEHAKRMGITASVDQIDFNALADFRNTTVQTMVSGLQGLIASRGITVFQGNGELTTDRTVHVTASHDNEQVRIFADKGDFDNVAPTVDIEATDIVLAMGSSPRPLPAASYKGALIDSTQALTLPAFPKQAAIIGSGAIALEFASMWNAAGSDVTVLIRKNNILSHSDRRAALALQRELKRQGIHIVTEATVIAVDADNTSATIHYTTEQSTEEQTLHVDIALAAVGRDPNTTMPWVSECGIELTQEGMVRTDPYGRTNLDHVWAVGDITVGHLLAHRAYAQGLTIAETIAGLQPPAVDEHTIPTVIFSTPEFASVGLTLQEAQHDSRYSNVQETIFPVRANARMMMSGSGGSFSLVSGVLNNPNEAEEQTHQAIILGAHLVTPDSSDLIAELQELVTNRVPIHEAAQAIHPHPTYSEMIGETLLKADNRPLHMR